MTCMLYAHLAQPMLPVSNLQTNNYVNKPLLLLSSRDVPFDLQDSLA